MSDIAAFKNIPDVSFIDFLTLEQVQELFRADFIQAYKNATGQTLTLNPADPINLVLLAESNQYYQALQYVDRAGKQDLLKYTYGEYLDNIALRSGLTRKGAGKAITTLRFTLSATRSSAVAIPAGTRVCTGDNVYFATTEYAEIKPAAFAATTLRFESTGEHDDIEIPAGSVAATADGVRFKTTQGVTLAACAAAMATLRFTLSAARSEAVTISAGTKVYADVAARAYTFPFVTGETVTIEASEKATTTLRFYPKAGATTRRICADWQFVQRCRENLCDGRRPGSGAGRRIQRGERHGAAARIHRQQCGSGNRRRLGCQRAGRRRKLYFIPHQQRPGHWPLRDRNNQHRRREKPDR